MERRISMSMKELSRLEELKKVHERRQTILQAAEHLGLSTRQVKRLSKRLKVHGPEGLISRKIGKAGNHKLPSGLKELALGLIQDHYIDFGPTLAHEYLTEKHRLPISVSSIRNIMIKQGIWGNKARRKARIFPTKAKEST